MGFKGEAVIELTDVNTGEKQVYKEKNMFTNALKYLYTASGNSFGAWADQYYFYPSVKNISTAHAPLGGILLFDTTIDEDPEVIFKPDGVDIVGHAGNFATTSTVETRGSLNVTESSIDRENGTYKWVWDFATDKANGTIACLSLTSSDYGYMGNSFEIYTSYCDVHSGFTTPLAGGSSYGVNGVYLPQYLYKTTGYYGNFCEPRMCYTPDGTKIYLITNGIATASGTTEIEIAVLGTNLCGINSLSSTNGLDYTSEDNYPHIDDITLTVSESFCTGYNLTMNADDDYFYIIAMDASEFHILKVAFDDLSTTEYTVPIGESAYTLYNSCTKHDKNKLVWDGYLYAHATVAYNYRLDKYNIETGELVASSPDGYSSTVAYYVPIFVFNGRVGILNAYYKSSSSSSYYYYFMIWDEVLNKWFYHNSLSDYCHTLYPYPKARGKSLYYYGTYYSSSSSSSSKNSASSSSSTSYLATINNLTAPVTKTATQTMKITYTVYEER